jgi:hypothetical protein
MYEVYMKKLNSTAFLSILLMLVLLLGINSNTQAQTLLTQQGDITVGGGLTLTTGVGSGGGGEIGINGNGFYAITNEIRAGLGLSLFFGDYSPTQINIDGHYLFINEDDLGVYALAGLGIWRWSTPDLGFGFGSVSFSTSGLNLGAGVEYDLGTFLLFGEAKLTTIAGTPFNLTGGVRFRF